MKQSKENVSKTGPAKPEKTADLIDYHEGSVVSRTIIDKKSGTVTLFAFDKGEGLSEHKAPFDAMVHIIDGEADITVVGESFVLREGEMTVIPANAPHTLRATQRFKMLLVMIRS